MAKAQLTNAGLTLLTNAQGGSDTITFTKMALGDGKVVDISVSSLTALVSQKAEMPIVSKKFVKSGTYQIGAYFSNENITTGFYWRETGIFAKGNDGKEILYCYVNVGDAPDYISVATDIRLEKYIYQTLSVGNSTTINITVNESEMLLTVADIGVAGGVAPLNENKKIDGEFLPDMNYAAKDHNHINSFGGFAHGENASALSGAAIGENAKETNGGGAIGYNTTAFSGCAVGYNAIAGNGASIGLWAKTIDVDGKPIDAIQLGTGTNPNPKTLQVYGYQLMDALGKIPAERLPTMNYVETKTFEEVKTNANSHFADTTKHITSAERTAWNKIENANFKLLKTIDVSVSCTTASNASSGGYNSINLSSFGNGNLYDEIKVVFNGTISGNYTSGSSASRKIIFSINDEIATVNSYNQGGGAWSTEAFEFVDILHPHKKFNFGYSESTVLGGGITLPDNSNAKTFKGNSISINDKTLVVSLKDLSTANGVTTVNGVLKIYGKTRDDV